MWRLSRYSLRSENICLWHFWTCRNWSLATALASVSRLLCVFARFAHDTAVIISALTANCVYVCARVAFSLARTLLLVCDEQSGRTTTTIDDRRSCEDRTRLSTIRLPIAPLWFSIDILARVFLSPLLFWFYCQSVACARTLCLCVCVVSQQWRRWTDECTIHDPDNFWRQTNCQLINVHRFCSSCVKMQSITVLVLVLVISGRMSLALSRCSRIPEGYGASKTPADGRYHIRITENTNKYVPGKTYTSE